MKKTLAIFLLIALHGICQSQIVAPDLQCITEDPGSNDIILSWTNRSNPCGPFVNYYIFRSNNINGPFTLIDSVSTQNQTSYTDVTAPAGIWYYYMEANFSCVGQVRDQSDTLCSELPAVPDLISVSVVGNSVVIDWDPSSSAQTDYYGIFIILNDDITNPITVNQVNGINNTIYTDFTQNPTLEPIAYTIAAFDSCGQSLNINTNYQRTIFLETNLLGCESLIELNWTRYINWTQGVSAYEVWVSKNNQPAQLEASFDSSILTFNYTNFNDFDTLCFSIVARNGDSTASSTSNEVCFVAEIVQPPAFINLVGLSVNLNNEVETEWFIDSTAEISQLTMYRSDDDIDFDPSNFINIPGNLNSFYNITDTGINASSQPYYYELEATDLCNTRFGSTKGRSIRLRTELTDFFEISLNWNEFEMDHAVVNNYNIYRNDGNGNLFLASVPAGTTSWINDISQELNKNGTFCYRIEAEYFLLLPNGYSKNGSSFSNRSCQDHKALIYIPPVYVPNQFPDDYKPVILFGESSQYTMKIFSRWGELIFESNNIDIGWDSNINGEPAPGGAYAYVIEFTASDGTKIVEEGILTLLR